MSFGEAGEELYRIELLEIRFGALECHLGQTLRAQTAARENVQQFSWHRTVDLFPVIGYFTRREGRLFVGEARNEVRLPPYARLDLRADHHVQHFGLRLTLFGEVMNALNRTNVGLASGTFDSVTGEAVGFTEGLLRRRISGGIVFDF